MQSKHDLFTKFVYGLHASALKKIAADNGLEDLALPKLFTIRWTEFSTTIINSMLRSWRALMMYFDAKKDEDATAKGYFKFLSNVENLQTILS